MNANLPGPPRRPRGDGARSPGTEPSAPVDGVQGDRLPLSAPAGGTPAGEGGSAPASSPAGPKQPGPVVVGKSTAGPGDQPRSWVIEMAPGTPILSANNRMDRYARNRRTQDLRDRIGALVACRYKLPRIGKADIEVLYYPPPRLKRLRHPFASECISDSDNLAPTGKALVDGIVACGIFPSDSKRYVRRVSYEVAEQTHPRGFLRVTITEVPPPGGEAG